MPDFVLMLTMLLFLETVSSSCKKAPKKSKQQVKSLQKKTDGSVVVIIEFFVLRCLRTTTPFPVIWVEPFAICIGKGTGSFSNIIKSPFSLVK